MSHSYNIVKDGSQWVIKTRKGGTVKSKHRTKQTAKNAARSSLPVGSSVFVYYASKSGIDNEFTITGK